MAQELSLNENHLEACDRILERCALGVPFAEKCKECGYPVDAFLEQLRTHQDIAERTKSTFFPHST